jgi:3'-phosphoadenosine 5'-phosphosulfate (PAPS) 3'-phosphatase
MHTELFATLERPEIRDQLLALFQEVALRAAPSIAALYTACAQAEDPATLFTRKPDGTLVSGTDLAISDMMMREVSAGLVRILGPELASQVALVSEEAPETHAVSYAGKALILFDPLDGTQAVLKGTPSFATTIGLVVDGHSELGCVCIPAQGNGHFLEDWSHAYEPALFWGDARRGVAYEQHFHPCEEGSLRLAGPEGEQHYVAAAPVAMRVRSLAGPLRVMLRPSDDLDSTLASWLEETPHDGAVMCYGSGQSKYMAVARGDIDVHRRDGYLSSWDMVGFMPTLLGAGGGLYHTVDGSPLHFTGQANDPVGNFTVIGDPALHRALRWEADPVRHAGDSSADIARQQMLVEKGL